MEYHIFRGGLLIILVGLVIVLGLVATGIHAGDEENEYQGHKILFSFTAMWLLILYGLYY